MDGGVIIIVVVFAVVAILGILLAWWLGHRLKERLDGSRDVHSVTREVLALKPGSADVLRKLTTEPVLLKQAEDGLRFQIDQRPMAPIAALAGQPAATALAEAAAAVSQRFGVRWVALVNPTEGDSVTVQRLA